MAVGKTVQINGPGLPDDINKMAGWGLAAARPATGDVLVGSFYYSTDTNILEQEQNGSWVAILEVEAIVAGAETYAPGYHAGNVGGLSAIDADLAVGNIKKDVNIFGKVGTYQGVLAEDVSSTIGHSGLGTTTQAYIEYIDVPSGGDVTLVTRTPTYDATAMVVASGWVNAGAEQPSILKIRLYMDGVNVAESAYVGWNATSSDNYEVIGIRALSGSKTCYVSVHNYDGSRRDLALVSRTDDRPASAAMSVGSVKLT